jgi:RNA polymerase sigma-70 factor (ECF subfamily)
MCVSILSCPEAPSVIDRPVAGKPGGGDRGVALRDCLVANYDRLHRRLLRHLGCPDQASDCLHDAWLRLGDMAISATVKNPEAYVYRVACNVAMDDLRNHRARGDADTELELIADQSPGPDLIAEGRFEVAAVDRAMQRLPRRHQAVLIALRINELTRDEVATCHGMSLRSVDTVLRQALDYCARKTDQPVMAGVRSPRRPLPQERVRA